MGMFGISEWDEIACCCVTCASVSQIGEICDCEVDGLLMLFLESGNANDLEAKNFC